MMAETVPDALPHEELGDAPTTTLNGGLDGNHPILAVRTQTAISGLRATQTGINDRLTTVEDQGIPSWVKVASGSESSVATFVIPSIPTGVYRAVRLSLFGSASDVGAIRLRFNSDNTAALHKYGRLTYDAAGGLDLSDYDDGTFWEFAVWGTGNGCSADITIYNTHVNEACSFIAVGNRTGGSAGVHQFTRSWGRLNMLRLLDSLRVSGPSGGTLSCQWWLEGSPA